MIGGSGHDGGLIPSRGAINLKTKKMAKPKYNRGIAVAVDSVEKQVKAIDNLITSGRLVVDMLQGTAAMDSYLWIYYTQDDKLMQGFCIMLRTWINFQRSWKKGELFRMMEEGSFQYIAEDELKMLANQKQHPAAMMGRVSPSMLRTEKLSEERTDEQKRMYLEEYINSRYCLWPDAAPVLVLCIGNDGKLIGSVEHTSTPPTIYYKSHE